MTIPAANTISLSGPSGTGKSRLLRAIVDLDPDTGGDAWIDSLQRSATSTPEWRKAVGYLPADSHWWDDHVGDHFTNGNEAPFAALGLPDSIIDAPISRLSTGERQRLGILRLLANQPTALLLDEPTANLDSHHTSLVEALLGEYQTSHQAPVIWVTHDPVQQQRVASRHFRIGEEEIVETGKEAPA